MTRANAHVAVNSKSVSSAKSAAASAFARGASPRSPPACVFPADVGNPCSSSLQSTPWPFRQINAHASSDDDRLLTNGFVKKILNYNKTFFKLLIIKNTSSLLPNRIGIMLLFSHSIVFVQIFQRCQRFGNLS